MRSKNDVNIGLRTCDNSKDSKLKIIALTEKRYKNGEKIWLCLCDCGNKREVKTSDLKKVRSCGCLRGRPKKINKESKE